VFGGSGTAGGGAPPAAGPAAAAASAGSSFVVARRRRRARCRRRRRACCGCVATGWIHGAALSPGSGGMLYAMSPVKHEIMNATRAVAATSRSSQTVPIRGRSLLQVLSAVQRVLTGRGCQFTSSGNVVTVSKADIGISFAVEIVRTDADQMYNLLFHLRSGDESTYKILLDQVINDLFKI
jgi:hypothetical protein